LTNLRPIPRYVGLVVLLLMAGFAAVGFYTIRRDVENLRVISQDNTQWSASQMEIELVRFRLALSDLRREPSQEALEAVLERFDILWSRVFLLGQGEVGESLRRYDSESGAVAALADYLREIDSTVLAIGKDDAATVDEIARRLHDFQQDLREYTLRIVRADSAASARVRERIQGSARATALISIAAVLVSMLSLALILRENRRQHQLAEANRRAAEQAEQASRAKSRFLSMMSHELRNPLNGILGPLALIGQGELTERHLRLVDQAQQSGQSMLQMLTGLLEYGELQDGRFQLKAEPFRLAALAEAIRSGLAAEGVPGVAVEVLPGPSERVLGDPDRLRQVFVHLTAYVLEGRDQHGARVELRHDGAELVGDIVFVAREALLDWRLDLLAGLSEIAPDQVSAEALRPLMARGLITATKGLLTLLEEPSGRRVIRVAVPAEPVKLDQIRVHLETRSAALAAIYQAALRSDRVIFVSGTYQEPVDVVLVDSTTVGEAPLMSRLRARFPGALFVALGSPQAPDFFDDVVETPSDMSRLRHSILGRLAS
jgi:signal transduction histidine kinase